MRDRARPVAAAVAFLTAVPVPRSGELRGRDLRRGAPLFPLVGAAIGAGAAAVAWGAGFALPPLAAATLGVATGVALTAALHLDGLGDVADGIGASLGGRDPSEAMRDPRVGAFGASAIVLDLTLKIAVTASLLGGSRFPLELVAAAALGRAAPLAMAAALPYAPEAGTGAWTRGVRIGTALAALAVASAIGAGAVGLAILPIVAGAAVVSAWLARWSVRRLGGATGDVFGAAAELSETVGITIALAVR